MRFRVAALSVALLFAVAACGNETSKQTELLLRVDLIDDAVKAVEAWNDEQSLSLIDAGEDELEYFEINATPTLVNVYVAASNATKAVAFIYRDGKLEEPAQPETASGSTVVWSDVDPDIDNASVYEKVVAALPESSVSRFVIARDAEFDRLTYRVVMVSDLGGEFAAYVEPSGKIIGGDLLG